MNPANLLFQKLERQQRVLHVVARVGEIGVQPPFNKMQWDMVAHVSRFKGTTRALSTATLGHVIPVSVLPRKKMAGYLKSNSCVQRWQPHSRD